MHHTKVLSLIFSLFFSFHASARVVTDTLQSSQKDQVIVTYNLKQSDERMELEFTNIRIKLGNQANEKHKKASETVAVFFDRIGGFDDIRFSGNITPKAISLSPELVYTPSPDGYFIFDPYQYPFLVFDNAVKGASVVNIPIYLARYVKKRHYEIISSCGTLEIKIEAPTALALTPPITDVTTPTPTQELIPEEELTDAETSALSAINSIMKRLPNQSGTSIDETLALEISAFEEKKKELEEKRVVDETKKADNEAFNQCVSIEACEAYLNRFPDGLHVDEVKAKKEGFKAAAEEKAKQEKKRNIWMIIGGVLLAILLFVGNQVMQALRSKRTQQNMLKMQMDAVNQAKNAAQNQAQGAIRKETNQVVNQVQQKGKNAVRDAVGGTTKPKGKGNNGRISI